MSPLRRSLLATKTVDWKTACVIASSFCLLLLSTPGVSVVRASDEIASAQGGQSCEVGGPDVKVTMEITLDRLRRDESDPSEEPSYALNSRGFNYRPEPVPGSLTPKPHPGAR